MLAADASGGRRRGACGRHLDFVPREVLSVVGGGEVGNVRVILPARKQTTCAHVGRARCELMVAQKRIVPGVRLSATVLTHSAAGRFVCYSW